MIGFGSDTFHTDEFDVPALEKAFSPLQASPELIFRKVNPGSSDPFDLYRSLYPDFSRSFILESSPGTTEFGRYTFIGFEPRAVLTLSGGTFYLDGQPICSPRRPEDFLNHLYLKYLDNSFPKDSKYLGGLVGYISYDFIRNIEDLPTPWTQNQPFPDMEFGLYLDGFVHDSNLDELYYFSHREDRLDKLMESAEVSDSQNTDRPFRIRWEGCEMDKGDFGDIVRDAKDYITSGDIYQVVLSKKISGKFSGDPFETYRRLRKINPSPYMYHLQFGERRVIGSSPEMLASVKDGEVTTYPIAGTRPLGQGKQERRQLREELLSDEKEKAEHNMLVDLARNDVGRVSEVGSVQIPQYMTVKEFSHVQHIVSEVRGNLRKEAAAPEALAALFPAGTVSGAPKVRAMEIIDELESSPRGPYAGAVGYISMNGNLDTCITIRSLFTRGREISLRAGAGIVADSKEEKEWQETDHKLEALIEALNGGGDHE